MEVHPPVRTNMMMSNLADYAYERDRAEFNLGDTLDIKTGIILACLTFLAIQAGELLKQPQTAHNQIIAQILSIISILALIVGGVFAVLVMRPRNYYREATPDEYGEWIVWIKDVEAYRRKHPEVSVPDDALTEARILSANERIQINAAINKRKSLLMFVAFWATSVSFIANILTLVFTRLF